MKNKRMMCGLSVALTALALTPSWSTAQDVSTSWNNALSYTSADKSLQMRVGGRFMHDWLFGITQDDEVAAAVGATKDGTEFRDVLAYAKGTFNDTIEFNLEYNFAGGEVSMNDAYLGFKGLPWGGLRIGHQKEPIGLEVQFSGSVTPFMEASVPTALMPNRNSGLKLFGDLADKMIGWEAGIFRETDKAGLAVGSDGGYNYTARLFAAPVYESEGETVVHLGAGYSLKNLDTEFGFKSAPEQHLAPVYINSGKLPVDTADLLGAELLGIFGPFSVQAEYMHAILDRIDGSEVTFPGYYVLASFFLTGEHRIYTRGAGNVAATKVAEPFTLKGGSGAVELLACYSSLDLSDEDVMGGELSDITVGLNWYMMTNAKVMLNYVHADLQDVGTSDAVQTRFLVFF